jgi:16S rRNA (cytidine1402-2'-O)-methyltransferase
LTKLHEQVRRGTLIDLAVGAAADPPRGEVTIVVAGETRSVGGTGGSRGGAGADAASRASALAAARQRVARMMADGSTRSAAAKEVARDTGLPRRELFHDPEDGS